MVHQVETAGKKTETDPTESIPGGKIRHWSLTLSIVGVLLVIAAAWIGIPLLYRPLDERSAFGDMFGAVNALFSGLAFACLIYAVFMQRQELALQRRELELTRQELQRSAAAQEEAHKALSEQARIMLQTAILNGLTGRIEALNHKLTRVTRDGTSIFGTGQEIANELNACIDELRLRSEYLSMAPPTSDPEA